MAREGEARALRSRDARKSCRAARALGANEATSGRGAGDRLVVMVIRPSLVVWIAPLVVALAPAEALAVKALLSRWNQSQIHVWDSDNPGATMLLHTNQCNDADHNLGEGSIHGWFANHNSDYFARFIVGSNMGFESQYILGQGGRTHYDYPKHITVHNNEVVVMSRNNGTLWRYSNAGVQIGSVKTAQNTGQGMASDGTDLYVSLWTGAASTFVRYDPAFVVKQTYNNPTGLGNFNNVVDLIHDSATGRFFGIATTGEGGTGTNSTTVVEFDMGGAVVKSYALPFAVDGIGAYKVAACGNAKVEPGEECDDGNMSNTDACTVACKNAKCGDGFVQANVEACDDGNAVNEDACTAMCEAAACGDGFVQAGVEECDDGNAVDDDACSNGCVAALCGDGIVQMGEGCDDGNAVDDDACSNACVPAACGDGVVQMGEACDDGNADDTDDCLSNCAAAACGDGVVHAGVEECDDPGDIGCVDCMIVVDETTGTGSTSGTGTTDATTGVGTTGPNTTGDTDPTGTGGGGSGSGGDTTGSPTTSSGGGSGGSSGGGSSGDSGSGGGGVDEGGCGCTSGGSGGGWLALLALVGLRRRRRA